MECVSNIDENGDYPEMDAFDIEAVSEDFQHEYAALPVA